MKEIGDAFKEARANIGISKSEIAKDLEITEGQLDNLEDGNVNAFKDIFFLKDLVKKYAKYLNLDEDEIIDKFNDFIFGYTSRIPLDDILEQTREINIIEKQNEDNKVISPYTIQRKKKINLKLAILSGSCIVVLIILIVIFIYERKGM